jgi:hypothetical protein
MAGPTDVLISKDKSRQEGKAFSCQVSERRTPLKINVLLVINVCLAIELVYSKALFRQKTSFADFHQALLFKAGLVVH